MKTEVMYCTCYNESRILEIQEEIKETADCTWKDSLPLCKPKNWKENTCRNYGRTKREISDDFEFDVPIDVVAFRKGPQVMHLFVILNIYGYSLSFLHLNNNLACMQYTI